MPKQLEQLKARGLIHDTTDYSGLEQAFSTDQITFYCGFDPTADSLHVGSMLPLTIMSRLQRAGHKPLVVLGTGTGMIGDPSGKSDERKLLTDEVIQHNVKGIKRQIELFLSTSGENCSEFLQNDSWIREISCIDFLRDVGKHFSVNAMMIKDSVRHRLENREQGISYTEFSYMLLQAYDFYWLYTNKNCTLQIGGSDQWGNIMAGIDLIRRKSVGTKAKVFGMTFPLVTSESGVKFGKTESGNIWLDSKRTSPFRFYQYWLNTQDTDVIRYLEFFTEVERCELDSLVSTLKDKPAERIAQRQLAHTLTSLIHGVTETERAERASKILFGEKIANVDEKTLLDIFSDVPSAKFSREKLSSGIALLEFLPLCSIVKSKSEAKRTIDGGGLYFNNERVSDASMVVTTAHLATESILVIRVGKKNYHLVLVE